MQQNTMDENLKSFALEFIDFLVAHKTDGEEGWFRVHESNR